MYTYTTGTISCLREDMATLSKSYITALTVLEAIEAAFPNGGPALRPALRELRGLLGVPGPEAGRGADQAADCTVHLAGLGCLRRPGVILRDSLGLKALRASAVKVLKLRGLLIFLPLSIWVGSASESKFFQCMASECSD